MDITPSLCRENLARARSLSLLLVSGLVLGSCSGDNAFPTYPNGGGDGTGSPGSGNPGAGNPGSADATPPTVSIELPTSNSTVAVGDSLFAQVQVSDDVQLASLELSGFALRGDRDLGTEERVDRFATKTVDLTGLSVRDTTLMRYLIATADTLPESPVYLVATATDTAGNVRADTLRFAVGGPRVEIASPTNGAEVRAGTPLTVRVTAADRLDRIRSVRLRLTGAIARDTSLALTSLVEAVDTAFIVAVPADASGAVKLEAFATNARNIEATGRSLSLSVLAPTSDETPPNVRFEVTARQRSELSDTVVVTVSATDDTQVAWVGASVRAVWQNGTAQEVVIADSAQAAAHTFRFTLDRFGVSSLPDGGRNVSLEVTAFGKDVAGNCAAATVTGPALSEPCRDDRSGGRIADQPGARTDLLVVRGRTVTLGGATDRFIDIVTNQQHIFLSNFSQSRVEVLAVGSLAFQQSIRVGSQPWGLALSPDSSTLLVANSGGTNISVVPIAGGIPNSEDPSRRIHTPNQKLFDVAFDPAEDVPSGVVAYDYSDRPQFIAQTARGEILYSTRPTGAAADGTLRRYSPTTGRVYYFLGYTENRIGNKVIIANALDAVLVLSEPNTIRVCPRPRPDGAHQCFTGGVLEVRDSLATNGYDTEFHFTRDISEVGLSDTTYVAVSGDHRTVMFGEGMRDPGRIIMIKEHPGSGLLAKAGEIRDLISNAAERITALALNRDGTLAAARGNREVYFFQDTLRLQGVAPTGLATGGVAMHPDYANWPAVNQPRQVAFVSGVENGVPFIDLVDTFHYDRRTRITLRDPVTGPIRVVRQSGGGLRVLAITAGGLVAVDVQNP